MNITIYTLKAVAYAITDPSLIVILLILAFILYRQNKKITIMQKMIIGERLDSPFELTISQIVIGVLAGATSSILLSYLGVIFDENSAIYLVFLLSLLFSLFNPRFICFSYSGGILGFISIILSTLPQVYKGIPNLDFLRIDIISLMTMVAVIHFIEGILVMLDGKTGAIPVFTNREDKIVGGFALQRYWAIPIAVFIILHNNNAYIGSQQIAMPNWWPIIKTLTPMEILKKSLITLIPFYAITGYSSVTFTKNKHEKAISSGIWILFYSVILFFLAQVARFGLAFQILAVLFAPIGHEFMVKFQRYKEISSKPKYVSSNEGIMVLEVAPNSAASQMGIKSGDLLIEINNKRIENEQDIVNEIMELSNFLWFKVKRSSGKIEELTYNKVNSNKRLGVVFVPRGIPKDSVVVKLDDTKFGQVLEKIKKRDEKDEDKKK